MKKRQQKCWRFCLKLSQLACCVWLGRVCPVLTDTVSGGSGTSKKQATNQLDVSRAEDEPITAAELLEPCEGE